MKLFVALILALQGVIYTYDGWTGVIYFSEEVKNPSRDLPLSLALGTAIVVALYVAANVVYLNVLPLNGVPQGATVLARGIKYAAEERVGTAVMQQMFGSTGAALMAGGVLEVGD